MPILWFIVIMGTLTTYPGLVDILKEVIGILYDDATFYGPKAAKRLMWGALAYIATLCFLAIFAAWSLAGQNAEWFAIAAFITAVMLLPLNNILNKAATAANMVLPTSMAIGTPKMLTLLILVVITSGLTALLFPNVLFSWYGFALLASMLLGLGVTIAFPSNRFLSRTVMGCVICAIFFLGVAKYGFPEYVEAFSNEAGSISSAQGRKNLQNKLALQPVETIISPKGASVWKVELLSNGDPKLRSDGFPDVKPVEVTPGVQKNLPTGTKFKTLDIKLRSVDVGEPVVQIFLEASDGSWVQAGDVGNNWIAVSQTSLTTSKTEKSEGEKNNSTDGKTVITNGTANAKWLNDGYGQYYLNLTNSFSEGGAYKFSHRFETYVYKNGKLSLFTNEAAFKTYYKCGKNYELIIDCQPIYQMPTSVKVGDAILNGPKI